MLKAHFMTPVGEFIAIFRDEDSALNTLYASSHFKGINGETLIIPQEVQRNSVVILVEDPTL